MTQVFLTLFVFEILFFLFISFPLILFIRCNIVNVVSTGKEVNVQLEERVDSVSNSRS